MYRHAPLIVSCAGCGVEQPLPRMTLGPRGGHQCWKCEVRAQIDAHGTQPENAVVRALRPRMRRPGALLALCLAPVRRHDRAGVDQLLPRCPDATCRGAEATLVVADPGDRRQILGADQARLAIEHATDAHQHRSADDGGEQRSQQHATRGLIRKDAHDGASIARWAGARSLFYGRRSNWGESASRAASSVAFMRPWAPSLVRLSFGGGGLSAVLALFSARSPAAPSSSFASAGRRRQPATATRQCSDD